MIDVYMFEVIGNPQPGDAAYLVDQETVSTGERAAGNLHIGTFSRRPITAKEAAMVGKAPNVVRWVAMRRVEMFTSGPNAGMVDGWSGK